MTLLVLTDAVRREAVAAFAESQGFAATYDPPATGEARQTAWARGEDSVGFVTEAASGAALLHVHGPGEAAVTETFRARFGGEEPAAVIAASRAATEPRAAVRALFRVGALTLLRGDWSDGALARLLEALDDPSALLREVALRLVRWRAERPVLAALESAASRHPELAPFVAEVREGVTLAEEGMLHDAPTDSWRELLERAREGVAKGQWRRVAASAEALLGECADHGEALYLRGLAYRHEGDVARALVAVGAGVGAESSRREGGLDPSGAGFVPEARAALAALREAVAALAPDARAGAAEAALAWVRPLAENHHGGAVAGAAEAVRGALPELDAWAAYALGDGESLASAADATGDSPTLLLALGGARGRAGDAAGARALYERALGLLREGAPRSPAAERVERFAAWRKSEATEARALEALARVAYDAKAWPEAAALADRLVEADPSSLSGWQMRANARTFALRHEEAVAAYDDALAALERAYGNPDSVVLGGDPRGLMRFNRACVLAKLGRRGEALDELRRAARVDAKWGADARRDDYWESLWGDPEFEAVAGADPRALVTAEERDPAHVRALVERCERLGFRAEVDGALEAGRRAVELAEWSGARALLAEALTAYGATVGRHRDAAQGFDLLERAWRVAEGADDLAPRARAGTAHAYAQALHAARRWGEAEALYRRGLALREAADGPSHPDVAKFHGDLARLEADRGGDPSAADAWMERGLAALEGFLAGRGERDKAWADATVDLAMLSANRAWLLLGAGDAGAALPWLARCVDALDEAAAHDWHASASFLDNARELGDALARHHELRDEALALALRLEALAVPGGPEERAERRYWRSLRRWAAGLRRAGVADAAVADAMKAAIRGDALPAGLRAHPELASLPAEMARRVARYPTFMVLSMMSLDLVAAGGALDKALGDLEELCVGSLLESLGGGAGG